MLKVFKNLAAKLAAVFPTTESSVSLLEDTNKVIGDGRNNIILNPRKGDIWCLDENKQDIYIVRESYTAATFPAAWTVMGVVAGKWGRTILRIPKEHATMKFMAVYPYKVTGMILDGEPHTVQIRLHEMPSNSTYYDFTYTASSLQEFVTQISAFLVTNNETDWSAYLSQDGTEVFLQYDNYTSVEYLSVSKTWAVGLILTARTDYDFPVCLSPLRRCGTEGRAIWNLHQAKNWLLSDRNQVAYNPTTVISSVPVYPVCWPAFSGTSAYTDSGNCAYLRERYCVDPDDPTLEDWYKYLADLLPANIQYGAYSLEHRNGKKIADMLKDIKYYNKTTQQWEYLYSAVRYCVDSIEGGFLCTWAEHTDFFKDTTWGSGVSRGEEDVVNKALYAIGGSTLFTASSYWSASRVSAGFEWVVDGIGYFGAGSFYGGYRVVPCSLSELPIGND